MPEKQTLVLERTAIVTHFEILGILFGLHAQKASWPGFECGINQAEYEDIETLIQEAKKLNGWFTDDQVRHAMQSWARELTRANLESWTERYPFAEKSNKAVGLIMAGNIPLVGFHDMLAVLMSGHNVLLRPSSDDHVLIRMVVAILEKLDDRYSQRISWAEGKMTDFDAIIATGSNNTARYFEYYFSKVPHIIRKNRNAIAILNGSESEEELELLGQDIFQYFGLGCRNVSKIYVPSDFDLDRFFKAVYKQHEIIQHNKYANNYDYHKSIYLLNGDNILENGFMLLKETKDLASPVATVGYERYENEELLRKNLDQRSEEIQCIVSLKDVPFGQAQYPSLSDYADGVDTMSFLSGL